MLEGLDHCAYFFLRVNVRADACLSKVCYAAEVAAFYAGDFEGAGADGMSALTGGTEPSGSGGVGSWIICELRCWFHDFNAFEWHHCWNDNVSLYDSNEDVY